MNTAFCIEILNEGSLHPRLVLNGFSGKEYNFNYNRTTNSHLRAYRSIEVYLAERVDLHAGRSFWPIMFNQLPADKISPLCWTTPAPKVEPVPMSAVEFISKGANDVGDVATVTQTQATNLDQAIEPVAETQSLANVPENEQPDDFQILDSKNAEYTAESLSAMHHKTRKRLAADKGIDPNMPKEAMIEALLKAA